MVRAVPAMKPASLASIATSLKARADTARCWGAAAFWPMVLCTSKWPTIETADQSRQPTAESPPQPWLVELHAVLSMAT